jgi:hypothetical protein
MAKAIDAHREGDHSDDLEMSYWTVQPNRWTFQSDKIREWVELHCRGRVLNACAGKTKLQLEDVVRNDIDEQRDADLHVDVCEIADHFERASFDTIVFDPPFSSYQANKTYDGRQVGEDRLAKEQFHELLTPGGRVVQLGYSTTCMPLSLGYEREAVAVFNTLGRMNDYLGTVDRRLNGDVREWGDEHGDRDHREGDP